MTTDTLLIELLTEELPPKVLEKLSTTFADEVFAALKEQALISTDSVCTPYCTPRRLAVSITNVSRRYRPIASSNVKGLRSRQGWMQKVSRPKRWKVSCALPISRWRS